MAVSAGSVLSDSNNAGPGKARPGVVCPGKVLLGTETSPVGESGIVPLTVNSPKGDVVRLGLAVVRLGWAWCGSSEQGMGYRVVGESRIVPCLLNSPKGAWFGWAWYGMAMPGVAAHGWVRSGMASQARHGNR